ncbi:MAG: glutamine--fructose-6-phosphate transaminase (isomerizing) [Caldisericia bacterium]|nr:glutamine--fructose-6-phosphate transaminase (isomerizing) [Caldisericia bacterium]
MCGVFGIVFAENRSDLGEYLVKASRKLVYRGYDSAGFATIKTDGSTQLKKGPGKLEAVIEQFHIQKMSGSRGIVQLRWATFGEPTEANSQPHYDSDGDIIGAHNGNIVNTSSLIEEFKRDGFTVRGQNDGEMVVHAFEKHFNQTKDPLISMQKAQTMLKGDYAFIVGHQNDHHLLAVKKGSSLYVGIGKDFIACSSDLASLLQFTNKIVDIHDGEMIYYNHEHYQLYNLFSGAKIEREPYLSPIKVEEANLEGFAHYMKKEIHEQIIKTRELTELLDNDPHALNETAKILSKANRIFIVASGTSYHASLIGSYYLNQIAQLKTQVVIAGQFNEYYGHLVDKNDVVFCVSQSGETKDVVNVINPIRDGKLCPIISMVNIIGSSIAHKSDITLNIAAGVETSVPATKTFMNQILLFLYLSAYIAKQTGAPEAEEVFSIIGAIPELIAKTIEQDEEPCQALADTVISKAHDLYCLGYGLNYGSAMEGALKIKEVYYRHCEGMYSSEFKHGPLSIVEEGYPILFPASPSESGMVISHINEITVRKGFVVLISPYDEGYARNANSYIITPNCHHYLTPFANVVCMQLIAYFSSVLSGYDPDFPRNISKTLTVD